MNLFDNHLARWGSLATIYSVTCTVAAWIASKWDFGTVFAPTERWWITFSVLGLVVPTAVFALIALMVTSWTPKNEAAKVTAQDSKLSEPGTTQITAPLAKHLLGGCLEDVECLTIELAHERGATPIKAKLAQLASLQVYQDLCRKRYRRDRALLKNLSQQGDEVINIRYAAIKDYVFVQLNEAVADLMDECSAEQAKEQIRKAAAKLGTLARKLDKDIENFPN
jgi:hypothetical protein